jgi:hypothetical protein
MPKVDRKGQARAHGALGRALPWLGRFDDAFVHLTEGLSLYEELADPIGQGECHNMISDVFEHQGNPVEALHHARHAL